MSAQTLYYPSFRFRYQSFIHFVLIGMLLGLSAFAESQSVSVSPAVTANGNFTIYYQNAPILTTGENHIMESKNGEEWVSLGKVTGASGNLPVSGKTAGSYQYRLRTIRCEYHPGQHGGGGYYCQPATYSPAVSAASIGAPGAVKYEDIDAVGKSFIIKWGLASGPVTSYIVEESIDNGPWALLQSSSALSVDRTHLTNGTTYSHQVKACSGSACTVFTAPGTVRLPYVIPASPGAPSYININVNNRSFTVKWTSPASGTVQNYKLFESRDGGNSWPTVYTTTTSTSYGITGKTNGAVYHYKVQACNVDGCGSLSPVTSITLPHPAPVPGPDGLSAPAFSETGSYTVSWSAFTNATYYRLEENGIVQNISGTSKAFSGSAAKSRGTYTYRVEACNTTGCAGFGPSKTTIVTTGYNAGGGTGGEDDGYNVISLPPSGPASSVPVGSTPGTFRVNETGAATYSIPLSLPTGTAGVTPQLSFEYSSQGSNGLMGLGWTLGGSSAITRCRQTIAVDGKSKAITWTKDDRFCLDGQRLVLDNGSTYGAVGATYKMAIDNYLTVTSHGGSEGHPQYFTVERKDGSRSRYGETADARLTLSGSRIMSWYQNKFEDSLHFGGQGNRIEFKYQNGGNGQRLSEVNYAFGTGSTPAVTIAFEYEDRPDVTRAYQGGQLLVLNKRLQQIIVKDTHPLMGQSETRRYKLSYLPQGDLIAGNHLSRLESVQECVVDKCIPATTFEWADRPSGFDLIHTTPMPDPLDNQYVKAFVPIDFSGDGHQDLVYTQGAQNSNVSTLYSALSDGQTFETARYAAGASLHGGVKLTPIDYNMDGRQDIAVYESSIGRWSVRLSSPQEGGIWRPRGTPGTVASTPITDPQVAFVDYNADGLVDAVSAAGYWPLQRNTNVGSSSNQFYHFGAFQYFDWSQVTPPPTDSSGCTPTVARQIASKQVGDFNGDGRVDFVASYVLSPGCPSSQNPPPAPVPYYYAVTSDSDGLKNYAPLALGIENTLEKIQLTDINGDGLADIYYPKDGKHYYLLNNGAGFNSQVQIADIAGISIGDVTPAFADFNGDGAADIYWKASSRLYIRMWTGTAFGPAQHLLYVSTVASTPPFLTDLNGDGLLDFVHIRKSDAATALATGLAEGEAANSIIAINNGLGNRTAIQYGSLGDNEHYERVEVNSVTVDGPIHRDCLSNSLCSFNYTGYRVTTADSFYERLNGGWNLPTGSKTIVSGNARKDHPTTEVTGAIYVVTRVASTAPTATNTPGAIDANATKNISYYYGEAKLQASGRGFLGFHKLKTVDEQSGVTTTTTYRQDYPFIGQPLSTVVFSTDEDNASLLSEAVNRWDYKVFTAEDGTKRYQPFIQDVVEKTYELKENGSSQGNLIKTVSIVTTKDDYGNVENVVTTTEGNGEAITQVLENSYVNDSGDWGRKLGRLSSTVTTVTSPGKDPLVRSSEFNYYPSGLRRGLLKQEIILPQTEYSLTSEHNYDNFGNKISITQTAASEESRSGGVTTYEEGRHVDQVTNALGQITSDVLARNKFGAPTHIQDANGVVTEILYDDLGREYLRKDSTGAWTWVGLLRCDGSISCPGTAQYRQESRVAGGGQSFAYFDALGRVVRETTIGFTGDLIHVDTEYDEMGRVRRVSNPYSDGTATSGWTENSYDLLGRLVLTRLPDNTVGSVITFNGYETVLTNALNQTKTEVRNLAGELVLVRDNLGGTVAYSYDLGGNLLSATSDAPDTNPVTVRMCYDSLGRKFAMHDPDKGGFLGNATATCAAVKTGNITGWWYYQYNGLGELTSQIDTKKQTTTMTYDALGRLLTRTDKRTNGTIEGHTRWYYDKDIDGTSWPGQVGNVTYVVQSEGSVSEQCSGSNYCDMFIYDEYGRQTDKVTFLPNADTGFMNGVRYDSIGRPYRHTDVLHGQVMPESGTRQHYNSYGYKSEVTDLASGDRLHRIIATNARGQVTEEDRDNGVTTHYFYDTFFGRIEGQESTVGVIFPRQDNQYRWDAIGNLKSRENYGSRKGNASKNNLKESFCYDGLNRLIKTHRGTLDPVCSTDEDVRYNGLGNITYKKDVGNYTYGSNAGPHAVTSAGGISYAYDRNGNMTSGDGRILVNNTFNKPIQISRGRHTTSFRYGPDRSRYQRVDYNSVGVETTTSYFGNVERIHAKNNLTVKWRRSVAGAIYTITTDLNNQIQGATEKSFVYTDHLGSTDVITAIDGSVIRQTQSFDAWGQRRNSEAWTPLSGADLVAFDNSITKDGYTGHEHMDEMGLIHMNGRVYDPKLARFLQADPVIDGVTNTQGYNRYSYLHNNPLNATDPSGFSAWTKFRDAFRPLIATIVTIVVTYVCGPCNAVVIGMVVGAMGAAVNGGNIVLGAAFGAFSSMPSAGLEGMLATAAMAGVQSQLMGSSFGHAFLAAGIGAAFGGGGGGAGLIKAAIIGGVATKITGGKFANGAITSAFMWVVNAGMSKFSSTPSDGGGTKIGQCAEKGKCKYDDFTPEERAAIQKRLDDASSEFLNKPNDSPDDAALTLHNSEVRKIAEELGIEVWARISGKDNSIYMVSTGFDNELSWGAVAPGGGINMGRIKYRDAVWHTHPSGKVAHLGDLESILNLGGAAIYASGKNLSRFENPNFTEPQGLFIKSGVPYTGHEYINGNWIPYQQKW